MDEGQIHEMFQMLTDIKRLLMEMDTRLTHIETKSNSPVFVPLPNDPPTYRPIPNPNPGPVWLPPFP